MFYFSLQVSAFGSHLLETKKCVVCECGNMTKNTKTFKPIGKENIKDLKTFISSHIEFLSIAKFVKTIDKLTL